MNQNSAKCWTNSREQDKHGYCSHDANGKFHLHVKIIQQITKRGDEKSSSVYTAQLDELKASYQLLCLPYSQLGLIPHWLHLFPLKHQPMVSLLLWLLVLWCKGPRPGTLPLRCVKCSPSPQTQTPATSFPVSQTSRWEQVLRPKLGSVRIEHPDCTLPLGKRMQQTKTPALMGFSVYWGGDGGTENKILKN